MVIQSWHERSKVLTRIVPFMIQILFLQRSIVNSNLL